MIGHDFEYFTEDTRAVPSEFRRDASVPLEGWVDPQETAEGLYAATLEWLHKVNAHTPYPILGGARRRGYSLGGHLHLSDVHNVTQRDRQFLDNVLAHVILGVSDVIETRHRAEGHYGALASERGYHRVREEKSYGFEYRTLPSPRNREMMLAYFGLASFARRVLLGKKSTEKCIYKQIARFTPTGYRTGNLEEVIATASWVLKRILPAMTKEERSAVAPIKRLLIQQQTATLKPL